MHAYLLLHARPFVALRTPICCTAHAHSCFMHAHCCFMHAHSLLHACPLLTAPSSLRNQSEQRLIGLSSLHQKKPEKPPHQSSYREPNRRSLSPDRHRDHKPTSDKPPHRNPDFQTSTSGRGYSACAVCLGRHPHKIIECNAPSIWDKSLPTLALRSNKILSLRDGRPVCADWQRSAGCSSSRHDNRHICSGCASPSHGAQECPRAQKASGSHSL